MGLLYDIINTFQIINKKLFEFELFIKKIEILWKIFVFILMNIFRQYYLK